MDQISLPPSEASSEGRRGSSPVAHTAVAIEDTFWQPRLQTLRKRTLFYIYRQLEQQGHFTDYYKKWKPGTERTPYVFWESDISKWLEAASYSLAVHPDPELEALVDKAIAFLASRQQPDGYLNIWFTAVEPEKRWTNLRDWHELYCAGHMIEGAVAHFQATGKRTLLDIVCRYADYIDTVFGHEEGKRRGYCGHEEIELALVKLYRATGEVRYLNLARYFVEERGQQPHYFDSEARARGEDPADFWARSYEYNQSHVPIREQPEVVGHAVRAVYLSSALADLAREVDDESWLHVCERFWQHLSSKRIYITGGIGPSEDNEGFTADYDLPNDTAYAETCAAIGLAQWSHRMLQLDTDRRYADAFERVLYNGALSGIALDGESFFYENPLESRGDHHRQPWHKCACCPPNISRLLASLGRYVYSVNEAEIMVHLYVQSTSTIAVSGQQVTLRQETSYPWDGSIRLSIEAEQPAEFGLNLRIPGWCNRASLKVNGEEILLEENLTKGYVRIARSWQTGDSVVLNLEMPIQRMQAHPDIQDDNGCVALQRGPLIYCLETADNAVPLHRIRIPETGELQSHFDATLLGGVVVIEGDASVLEVEDWAGELYRATPAGRHSYTLVAIPYYAWDNRQPGEMRVWIRAEG
ncbi:MAG TPA: beta-L-arabinofuranosidase domain-containing protein [Ktedonobacteraceae bacterium]|nr:beta-L-arabinofuranosidase domain-containing protein [Ktedonobacteraceae bacterium]